MYFDEPASVARANQRADRIPLILCFGILCAVVAFFLGNTWLYGACFPEPADFLARLAAILTLPTTLVVACVVFRSKDSRAFSAAVAALSLLLPIGALALSDSVESYAVRRDIGRKAQEWAVTLLQRPRSQIVDAGHTTWPPGKIKDSLVPAYLRKGYYAAASIEESHSWGNEPYIVVCYRAGHLGSQLYYLGSVNLRISKTNDAANTIREDMPGVYTVHSAY